MCTLILLDRVVPGVPLVIAANRDEFLARPAAPPAYFAAAEGRPAFVAPQDLEAGGTWMGLNGHGLFVGLTNRPTAAKPLGARSRGLLVLDALARGSAAEVASEADVQRATSYAPFNLLAADGRETCLVQRVEGGGQHRRRLDPGIHVVCNRDADDPSSAKVGKLGTALAAIDLTQPLEALVEDLIGVLRGHPNASNPVENPCVHTTDYGTRSSSVLAVGRSRRAYWYAHGAPCESKYRDFGDLLSPLGLAG
jgi:uncharacterized protein with NRDE domain